MKNSFRHFAGLCVRLYRAEIDPSAERPSDHDLYAAGIALAFCAGASAVAMAVTIFLSFFWSPTC